MITTTYPPIPGESQTKKIALIPGHGMWPTVCESVVDVFSAINAPIEWKLFE